MKVRIVLLATALIATLTAVGAATPARAVTKLPVSPASRITVVTWNAGDLLTTNDIKETRDQQHFAARLQSALTAAHSNAPDVVLLQEVTLESAATIATQLTSQTGYTFKVAVKPENLAGAYVCAPKATKPVDATRPVCAPADQYRSNETSILYNTTTMTMPTTISPAFSRLTYDESASQTGKIWLWLGAATVQLKKTNSGKLYNFFSLHYRTQAQVYNQYALSAGWTNFLKSRIADYYKATGGIPIMGGDTNNDSNTVVDAFETPSTAGPGTYNVARPGATGIDLLASTAPVVAGSTKYDSDYKVYKPTAGDGYFDTRELFVKCDDENSGGTYSSATAKAIDGCQTRYYSDHSFVWAAFGS